MTDLIDKEDVEEWPHEPDERTPSPPFGYSRPCTLNRDEQIEVVAQFHANHIRPNRIAYRMGVDIALVEALIAGEEEPQRFAALVDHYRRHRYRERMRKTARHRGTGRYELQQQIEKDFQREGG
ncbi:MAG: hypothetical protein AB8B57_09815 [Congregibacter sp.]